MNSMNVAIILATCFSFLEVLIAKPLVAGGSACNTYTIISARGTGETQARPIGNRGFINGVLAAVPGGANHEVVYPASADFTGGPIQGAAEANSFLTQQKSQCPEQTYVLIGYSQGAMVVTQTMRSLSISPDSVVAIVMYGNPFFTSGAPQNMCAAKTGSGIASATGITMPAQFSSITFDCCLKGDEVCQTFGSIIPHLSYPGSSSEKAAIDFAVARL
ncbi:family 5 carbohydrate esterase [Melampsora larici-populina 98AG31]|uniref:Family 5 carbohydrate esterase n=1 Tax=Melampsora larici-populina (strain 98AG31 / pathotype 3-4-7) TaxID=747676 RepID=F4RU03_MELLP|nr:family 5 carbohydrate esterase [Melampsora larici-populina 98AG31]EGG04093.1 family 5 carbohydrate esterase [Melampsora larici-populina 98AG31]